MFSDVNLAASQVSSVASAVRTTTPKLGESAAISSPARLASADTRQAPRIRLSDTPNPSVGHPESTRQAPRIHQSDTPNPLSLLCEALTLRDALLL